MSLERQPAALNGGAFTVPRALALAEIILVMAALVVFSEGLAKLFGFSTNSFDLDGSPLARALFYPAYLVGLIGVSAVWERAAVAIARVPFITLLVLLAFASSFWSVDGDLTFRRGIALLMTTIFGIYLAVRFPWRQLIEFVAGTYLILGLLSVFMAVAMPSLGVMTEVHVGAWSGIFVEKNALGGHMARGLAFTIMAFFLVPRRAWLWGGTSLLLIALVLLSTSKTSLLGAVLVIGLIAAIGFCTNNPITAALGAWATVSVLGVFTAVIMLSPQSFFGLIGRDATLTGRTDIWEALQPYLAARPMLGYGYAGFWNGLLGPAFPIREQLEWLVPNAHNGWIEVQLGLGFVGLALVVAAYAQAVIQGVMQALRWPIGACAMAYLLAYLLFSTSESMLVQHNNLTWLLFVMVAAKLAMPDASHQVTRATP